MNSDKIKQTIREHSAEIVRLHNRLHQTFDQRELSAEHETAWKQASTELQFSYDSLAFLGGLTGAYERILGGDPEAMESAVCFLEVRPYFFRSGYIYKDLLRKCKRAPLSPKQRLRFDAVLSRFDQYRQRRRRSA